MTVSPQLLGLGAVALVGVAWLWRSSSPWPSSRYTLATLTRSGRAARDGIRNTPGGAERAALAALAVQLDNITTYAGPLSITSGYRSPTLNDAVGGSDSSQHMHGEAVDCKSSRHPGIKLPTLLFRLVQGGKVQVDQVIYYPSTGHTHVSYTTKRSNRNEFRTKSDTGYPLWRP